MDQSPASFEETWEAHKNFVYRLLRDRYQPIAGMDVDDLAQEIAIRAWKGWHTFDRINVLGWLNVITRNTIIDILRRQRVRKRAVAPTDFVDFYGAAQDVVDTAAEAEYLVEENRDFLDCVLATFTPKEAALFSSVYVHEQIYKDAGRPFGLSGSTVCRYLKTARQRLRQERPDLVEQYAHV